MKKKQECLGIYHDRWQKIGKIMKLRMMLVCLFSCCLSVTVLAQQERVNIRLQHVSLRQVLEQIREQTQLQFMMSKNQEERVGLVSVNAENETVTEVLNKIFASTGLTWSIREDIIVVKEQAQPQVKNPLRLKGVVKDDRGHPLPGVTVLIKGTTMGVVTDENGNYSIELPDSKNIRLIFSFIGMKTREVAYSGQKEMNMTMQVEVTEMDEVVITGYQTVDRRKNTSAVTTVKMEDLNIPGVSSIDQMLQGRIPDMMFSLNSGEVGVVPKLRIRGTSTLIGNREPLWVLDGIIMQDPVNISPQELNDPDYINRIGNAIAGINPQDIERIDVLKDAAATALYGTKAANGVIVVTTKKGHVGKPVVSYNTTITMRQRPRYTDRSVDVMNSKERVQFSRDLVASHYEYPPNMNMIGYEYWLAKLYTGEITQQQFDLEIAKIETTNTDWFDLLTKDSFSHNHTLSISGGSKTVRYYASFGYNRDNDVIADDNNQRYTANIKLDANLASWLTASVGLIGNTTSRTYYQEDLAPMNYAYKTSRAIPAFDENGDYFYYKKKANDSMLNTFFDYNILNELENSSYEQEGSGITANVNLQFRFTDWLNANAIFSYSTNHTAIEGWWGENSWYAASLRKTEKGIMAPTGSGTLCTLPYGGELSRSDSDNRSYTARLQLNASRYFGMDQQHNISGSFGLEANSSRIKSFDTQMRGYYKDRGMSFVNDIDLSLYPDYQMWLASNTPILRDAKSNSLSTYISLAYSYFNYFTVNVNARVDGSNKFGDQSNDKLLPVWSASANWNLTEHEWLRNDWLDFLSLKASFGYQGNMLEDQTPVMVIKKGALSSHYNEYISNIERYPNPDLRWEKTTSYNLGIDFSLFKSKLQVDASVYWKHTEDAFMTKTIATMNGVRNNSYIVNGGNIDNQGYSLSLTVSPINNRDFRWSLSTSFSQVFNKLKTNPDGEQYELENFLDGSVLIENKPVGTFYSYRFLGLSPVDGGPVFEDCEDERDLLLTLNKRDFYTRILEASGRREPTISGNLNTSIRWKNIHFSGVFAYSLGNKIRLFSMYNSAEPTLAVQEIYPENNVSRDLLKRWQYPGDERRTDVPAIITPSDNAYYKYNSHWSSGKADWKGNLVADNSWNMYDYGNHRVVSGNFLKCSSLSLSYDFGEDILKRLSLERLSLTLSATNLFTVSAKELKGQTPTQSGFATIQLSERPTYSLSFSVSF